MSRNVVSLLLFCFSYASFFRVGSRALDGAKALSVRGLRSFASAQESQPYANYGATLPRNERLIEPESATNEAVIGFLEIIKVLGL